MEERIFKIGKRRALFSEIPCLHGDRVTLRGLTQSDAEGLRELTDNPSVYRYLPTYLFEKKYPDTQYVIQHLYNECLEQSLILGIFMDERFCGLAEIYGYNRFFHKASVGYRLLERCWGQGIATETLCLMISYLSNETDVDIITASTMVENAASANVLRKNDFKMVLHGIPEDWGYERPTIADKWIRMDHGGLWRHYQINRHEGRKA